jgi:hypothetical protein
VQFQDNGYEAATCHGEEVETSLEGLAVFGFIALVDGCVPKLPASKIRLAI